MGAYAPDTAGSGGIGDLFVPPAVGPTLFAVKRCSPVRVWTSAAVASAGAVPRCGMGSHLSAEALDRRAAQPPAEDYPAVSLPTSRPHRTALRIQDHR